MREGHCRYPGSPLFGRVGGSKSNGMSARGRSSTQVGQMANATWEVGVRRTFALGVAEAWQLLPSLLDGDAAVGAARSITENKVMRLSYLRDGWAKDSTLQLRVVPARGGVTIAIHHEGLPGPAEREAMRERWMSALDALAERLA